MEIASSLQQYIEAERKVEEMSRFRRFNDDEGNKRREMAWERQKELVESIKNDLIGMGIPESAEVFGKMNLDNAEKYTQALKDQQPVWEQQENLIKRNTAALQEMAEKGKLDFDIFSRDIGTEKKFPTFASIKADQVGLDPFRY